MSVDAIRAFWTWWDAERPRLLLALYEPDTPWLAL